MVHVYREIEKKPEKPIFMAYLSPNSFNKVSWTNPVILWILSMELNVTPDLKAISVFILRVIYAP